MNSAKENCHMKAYMSKKELHRMIDALPDDDRYFLMIASRQAIEGYVRTAVKTVYQDRVDYVEVARRAVAGYSELAFVDSVTSRFEKIGEDIISERNLAFMKSEAAR